MDVKRGIQIGSIRSSESRYLPLAQKCYSNRGQAAPWMRSRTTGEATAEMTPPDEKYFRALYERRATAEMIPFMNVSFSHGRPKCSLCHKNVATWVRENPECTPVRGWLIRLHGENQSKMHAHSVVSRPDGTLFDITPMKERRPNFLRHTGTEDEFFDIENRHKDADWPPLNFSLADF
jgi:hypothetical protein